MPSKAHSQKRLWPQAPATIKSVPNFLAVPPKVARSSGSSGPTSSARPARYAGHEAHNVRGAFMCLARLPALQRHNQHFCV